MVAHFASRVTFSVRYVTLSCGCVVACHGSQLPTWCGTCRKPATAVWVS